MCNDPFRAKARAVFSAGRCTFVAGLIGGMKMARTLGAVVTALPAHRGSEVRDASSVTNAPRAAQAALTRAFVDHELDLKLTSFREAKQRLLRAGEETLAISSRAAEEARQALEQLKAPIDEDLLGREERARRQAMGHDAAADRYDRLLQEADDLLDEVAETPARTLEGIKAKLAELVSYEANALNDSAADDAPDRLARSILRDVLALPSP